MKVLSFLLAIVCSQTAVLGQATTLGTSNFNEGWLDAVISIEQGGEGKETKPLGTGFLVNTVAGTTALVTAAHVVLKDDKGPRDLSNLEPSLSFRRSDVEAGQESVADAELTAWGGGSWHFSAEADLAVRKFGWPKSGPQAMAIPVAQFIEDISVEVGGPVLVLGFPTGLRSTTHKEPIVRRGMVARVGPEGLMVEAFVFPGNSGGPIVYVPVLKVGRGLNQPVLNEEKLLGMITSYVPYRDVAVSSRTGNPRVLFEENSGLSEAVTASMISALLEKAGLGEPK